MKQMVEIYIKLAELETRREVSQIDLEFGILFSSNVVARKSILWFPSVKAESLFC